MRLSSSTFILLFNFLLAGIASYMGGSLLSTWLHHQVLSFSDSSSGAYSIATEKLPVDPGKAENYFGVILERNIFNAQKTEIEVTSEPPPDLIIQTPETGEEEVVEQTSLALALAGTMIYGAKSSFAFISKKDSLHNYVIFGTGECFNANTIQRDQDCEPESVKILEIKDRWVLILHDGKKQALWMRSPVAAEKATTAAAKTGKTQQSAVQDKKTKALIVSPKEKNAAEVTVTPSSSAKGENTYNFQRVWVDEQLADFGQLLNDARVIPTKKDGKPYFMFQYIKKESIYEQLGLKPNDIILEINGFIVDTVDKALKLLEVLQSEREIALMVEREGKPVQFHYFID